MKYKPLDLSFIQSQYSPQGQNIRNTAAMIMANAGWSKQSQAALSDIAKYNKKNKASQHKQSFLGGIFDLLSTPLYGVANALDESMAGHQSDSNDSVMEDVLKTAGGVFTGGAKGIGAGLRGATSIVDVLPGVDINDDWQSNPQDKTHFSDVAIRKELGMSTADAMKPENWDSIKGVLQGINNKPWYEKTLFQAAVPNDLEQPDAREEFFRNNALAGIPVDIGADPLNLVFMGGKSAANATKALTEGLDEARAAEGSADSIINALKNKNPAGLTPKDLPFTPKPTIDAGYAPPVAAIDEGIDAASKINVNSISPVMAKGNFKDLANLGRREIPKQGLELPLKNQKALVKQIATMASTGEKGWLYKAADLLRTHPNIQWTQTEGFLQRANSAVKGKHNPDRMAPVLAQHIASDVKAARTSGTVERRVMNKPGEIVIRPGAPKLKRSEAQLANQIVRKFENEILGRGRAPGTGEGLARAIAGGANVRYSGPQQARMWNQITSSLKYADARKFDKTVRILRATEDYFISKGVIPHSAAKTSESVPLRLSQVAEALGPQVLAKSHAFITGILRGDPKALAQLSGEQVEAIQALRASEAAATAPAVQKGLDVAKSAADQIAKLPASVGRKTGIINAEVKRVREFTAAQGAGDVGAHVVGEYMGNLLGRKDAINSALHANRLKTEAWLAKSVKPGGAVNDADFLKAVTNAIAKAAELPTPAQLSGLVGSAARVKDWLGARFNAAYGVQDMRQTYLIQQAGAMSTTAERAKLINNLGRRFDPKDLDLWHEAFRAAQLNGIADGRVAELHAEIAKVMENLFGGTGLRSGAIADSTVVGRNRLLVDELNRNLKRFGMPQHQFSAGKKVKDAAGVEHDFSKGMDWMKSWEAWNVKNPYEFLHRVQNAIEHTVREKNMFDEIASRFGSPAKHSGVKYGVDHPRLRGVYFTDEGARQARVFVRMLEEVSTPNSKSLQYFDHVLSKLKASLTIYIPGHHWTNLIGDTYYNWIAGVNKPIRYEQAMKTMLAQKGRYGQFAEIGKANADSFDSLAGPGALQQAIARSMVKPDAGLTIPAAGNKVIVTMQNGTKVTADMIYTAAMREGILPSARVLEEVGSDITSALDKIHLPGKLKGSGQRAVHTVSEVRDHIPRLAQFIDGIAKSRSTFTTATNTSARSVRKWHPDGLDLTKFERDVMKRVFPFYSWTRKAIPLAIESAIFAGPKVMAYPRLMEAIALSNGVDASDGTTDPFPNDQMFPDWLRARGIGPVGGGPGNYSVVNPSTPVLDIFSLIGNPGQSALDMANPMGKVPIELMQGETLGRSVPINDYGDYAAKQIPAVSHIGRASGQFGVSDSTKAEGFPNWTNIVNMLTGLKKVDTGKYQKSGQFDLRDYFKQKSEQQFR
jgi:hypothetical protein